MIEPPAHNVVPLNVSRAPWPRKPDSRGIPQNVISLEKQRLAKLLFGTKNKDRWAYIPPHGEGELPLFATDITAAEAKEAGFPTFKMLVDALNPVLEKNSIDPKGCFDSFDSFKDRRTLTLYEHEYHSVRDTLKGQGISR